jgi:hypothetical protein
MELKIVEYWNGVNKFDTSVAQGNVEKYSTEKRGLERALERTNFELKNAEKIRRVLTALSLCCENRNDMNVTRYFFFSKYDRPAIPSELSSLVFELPLGGVTSLDYGYEVVRLSEVKKVRCPGCTEMRELIGYQNPGHPSEEPGRIVLCGNSIHHIRKP